MAVWQCGSAVVRLQRVVVVVVVVVNENNVNGGKLR